MDKVTYIKSFNIIGYANWQNVILIFAYITTMRQKIPYIIGTILGYYLKFSFVPPLITTLAVIINKDLKSFNLTSNGIFLILYVLIFFFAKYMIMHA